jgi:hypothetical protein
MIVSETEFAVLPDVNSPTIFGFFPGLVPDEPLVALPIEEIFPELASVKFDSVTDLVAIDGHIFMTLSGPDGLFGIVETLHRPFVIRF